MQKKYVETQGLFRWKLSKGHWAFCLGFSTSIPVMSSSLFLF